MSKRRRIVAAGLTVFVLAVIAFSSVSTTWHTQMRNAQGLPTGNVAFTCGPLLGSNSVRGPATTTFPVIGTPCGTRSQDQIMVGLDVILGVLGLVLLVRVGRPRRVAHTVDV